MAKDDWGDRTDLPPVGPELTLVGLEEIPEVSETEISVQTIHLKGQAASVELYGSKTRINQVMAELKSCLQQAEKLNIQQMSFVSDSELNKVLEWQEVKFGRVTEALNETEDRLKARARWRIKVLEFEQKSCYRPNLTAGLEEGVPIVNLCTVHSLHLMGTTATKQNIRSSFHFFAICYGRHKVPPVAVMLQASQERSRSMNYASLFPRHCSHKHRAVKQRGCVLDQSCCTKLPLIVVFTFPQCAQKYHDQ